MYKSNVQEVGEMALAFEEEKVIILFGPQAPNELREVSIIHEAVEDSDEPIKKGGNFVVDDQVYTIEAVGSSANDNLNELGHISIYFQDVPEDVLPGAVFVSPKQLPKVSNNSTIEFK